MNQPHERLDSDEIELKDSEDGCFNEEYSDTDNLNIPEDSDDCEFNSLEGKMRPSQSRIPTTQAKFNQNIEQLNKMNRLDVANQQRI